MEFLEKNLEDLIFETDRNLLKDRGLDLRGKIKRQLRIGHYGIADIITCYRLGEMLMVTIYELKKDKIGVSAFLQAVGYAKGVKDYLEKRGFIFVIKIVLIGREIDSNSTFCYLEEVLNSGVLNEGILTNYIYKYSINGLEFKKYNNYSLIDNGFNIK